LKYKEAVAGAVRGRMRQDHPRLWSLKTGEYL